MGGITAQAKGGVLQHSFENMPPPKVSSLTGASPMKKPSLSHFQTEVFNSGAPHGFSVRKPLGAYVPNITRAKQAFNPNAIDKENYPAASGMPCYQQKERSLVDIEQDLVKNLAPKPVVEQKIAPRKPLQEAAPLKENKPVKKASVAPSSPSQIHIPNWDEMPPVSDDGKKPAYSYATLIGMAILRAPERRLTLAQIYKWISDTFAYYNCSDHGWQNSIRHNLSLNKALVRQERPKDEPGKGSYWTIKPGLEYQFMGGRGAQKRSTTTTTKKSSNSKKPSSSPLPPLAKEEPADILPSLPPIPTTDATEAQEEEPAPVISSDATLTATPSPRAPLSSIGHNMEQMPYLNFAMPSSPPRHLQSSPPMRAPALKLVGETPPQLPMPRKRKHSTAALNDSGYISSLESSVMRQTDEERRIKRGRAEEDIARIRRSSIAESPVPRMARNLQPRSAFMTSSPLPPQFDASHLAPLTPATTLHPRRIPQSASPNTSLRNLREQVKELVGSPSREEEVFNDTDWDNTFETFINTDASPYVQPDLKPDMLNMSPMPYIRGITCAGSPYKKPAAARQLDFDTNPLGGSLPSENFFFNGSLNFLDGAEEDFTGFLDI